MAKKRDLKNDPRWRPFIERYAFDLKRFFAEVIKTEFTWQQELIFDSVELPGSRTSVSSGHGTGKSRGLGGMALWHLLCYEKSNTMITAPKIDQVRAVAWKEMADCIDAIKSGPHRWIADYIEPEAEKIYVKGYKEGWFIIARTAPRGQPENLAGMHRDWLLIIADEASGIPDANYSTLTGALTDARNRMALFSQPTRSSGYFYETHNSLSTDNGGPWTAIVLNSEESPLVSPQFIRDKLLEYGGADSEEYLIRVKGQFPTEFGKYMLGRPALERCFGLPHVTRGREWGWVISVDVAAGEYRDKSVVLLNKVWGHSHDGRQPEIARRADIVAVPVWSNSIKPPQLAGTIADLNRQLSNATTLVDCGGYGLAVYQRLRDELGVPNVQKVLWGNPNFRGAYKERFFNQRAQATYSVSRAAREGRLSICEGRHKKDMLDQGSRIPYHFDEKARYVIESKGSAEWEGLPSPDLWDAAAFPFLETANYMIAEGALATGRDAAADAQRDAEEAFAEL